MEWVIAAVAVVVLGVAAVAAAGHLGSMPEPEVDTFVPAERTGRLTANDLRTARFGVSLRGYDMRQVDRLLDRLAAQLDAGAARPADQLGTATARPLDQGAARRADLQEATAARPADLQEATAARPAAAEPASTAAPAETAARRAHEPTPRDDAAATRDETEARGGSSAAPTTGQDRPPNRRPRLPWMRNNRGVS